MTLTAPAEAPVDDGTPRGDALRRALEGVIGVPATEGNHVEVLRNGNEIFPAMLEAIGGAESHDRSADLRLLEGRHRERFAEALAERAGRASASACSWTRGARTRSTDRASR